MCANLQSSANVVRHHFKLLHTTENDYIRKIRSFWEIRKLSGFPSNFGESHLKYGA